MINQWLVYEHYNQQFNYLFELGKRGYTLKAKTFMDIMSPVAQTTASHHFLRDYCKEHHKKYNPARCAFVYAYAKPWEEFNQ